MYKFVFVWIVNEMTFNNISDYAERAEQKSLHKPWLDTLGLIAITHRQKYNLFLKNPALSW